MSWFGKDKPTIRDQIAVGLIVTVLGALLVVLILGGNKTSEPPNHPKPHPPPNTTSRTQPGTDTGPKPSPTPPKVDTLGKLSNLGRVDIDYTMDLAGTTDISGTRSKDAVTGEVFPDDGPIVFKVETNADYASVTGVVGISDDSACKGNSAEVSIADDEGATVWGPQTVTSRNRAEFSISITEARELTFSGDSGESGSDDATEECGRGRADPAWGDIEFVSK